MLKNVMFLLFLLLLAGFIGSDAVFAQAPPWQTGESRAEDLQISLVTFGRGEEITTWWGHTALIVQDTSKNIGRIYNFGLFSFEWGWMAEFAMGRFIFSSGAFKVWSYLNWYVRQNRDVRILLLNLPPEKKMWLAKELSVNVLPQNKNYLYDHYYENCSTRIRDFIDTAVEGQLKEATMQPARLTLREHTRRYIARSAFMEILLMYLMNDDIDEPIMQWDEMFLPDELEKYVAELEYIDPQGQVQQLVEYSTTYYQAKRPPVLKKVPPHWPGALLAGIVLGLLGLAILLWHRNRRNALTKVMYGVYHFFIGLLLGIPGLMLALMGAFSEHTLTHHNENLFLANPLTFLFIVAGIGITLEKRRAETWMRMLWYVHLAIAALAVILKIFPAFNQDNWMIIAFVMPVYVIMSLGMQLPEKSALLKIKDKP